jgi:predicted nuclease of predicted toxin-antitoxin system
VRALLDEQLSPEIASRLRSRGLDVEAVAARPGQIGMSDEEVVDVAAREGRAVVTSNVKDFRPIVAARLAEGRGHEGLILLPATRTRTRAAAVAIADGIEAIMRANPGGIAGSGRWLPPSIRGG